MHFIAMLGFTIPGSRFGTKRADDRRVMLIAVAVVKVGSHSRSGTAGWPTVWPAA